MALYSIGFSKTTAAAAGLIVQLRAASASRDFRLYEVGVFAGTAVACEFGLYRPTNVGSGFTSIGPGAAHDSVSGAGAALLDTAATTAPTIPAVPLRQPLNPATIGAGIIFPFPQGLVVPAGGSIALWQLSTSAVKINGYVTFDE